jgi:hypothetical protein
LGGGRDGALESQLRPLAHQVARATRKIRVGYMARNRCPRVIQDALMRPGRVRERGQRRGGRGWSRFGVECGEVDGDDASERSLAEIQTRRCACSPQRFFFAFPFTARESPGGLRLFEVVAHSRAQVRRIGEIGLMVIASRAPKTLFHIAASFFSRAETYSRFMQCA